MFAPSATIHTGFTRIVRKGRPYCVSLRFKSPQLHQNSKPTVLGWLCCFRTFPAPRGVPGDSACATASVARRKFRRFHPVSIPFCSLFSKNSGEPCRSGTRRTRLKATVYTCVEKGGLTGGLVQESGRSACDRAISLAALSDSRHPGTSARMPATAKQRSTFGTACPQPVIGGCESIAQAGLEEPRNTIRSRAADVGRV
jgi:hypothetical protein